MERPTKPALLPKAPAHTKQGNRKLAEACRRVVNSNRMCRYHEAMIRYKKWLARQANS